MINIPTELLRTFVSVVDMRSFTRAAQWLGVTQPAVSAQIKRLQHLLGSDLMDKSAPGVSLTPAGELVLGYARRLLAIHDQILNLAGPPGVAETIRVGLPGDFVGTALWHTLAVFRKRWPDVRFHVQSGSSEPLMRDLRQGALDLTVAMSGAVPYDDASFHWTEDMVWVRAPLTKIDPARPVPLVSHGDKSVLHRHIANALERAGFTYDPVFIGTSLSSLASAVGAGLGVMALPRSVCDVGELVVWEDGPLPPLPAMVCNICVRPGADGIIHQFAQALADGYAPERMAADRQSSPIPVLD
jgi:DNA-binding transcriptional LysR family regulator